MRIRASIAMGYVIFGFLMGFIAGTLVGALVVYIAMKSGGG